MWRSTSVGRKFNDMSGWKYVVCWDVLVPGGGEGRDVEMGRE
jgi:hypothetical protein